MKNSSNKEKENQSDLIFSNDMTYACKTICRICQKPVFLTTLRGHTRSRHNVPIDEYKKVYGNHRNAIIEKVYHKCGICMNTVLLDSDEIAHHLRSNHSLSHKNYNAEYMVTKTNSKNTQKEKEEKWKVTQDDDSSPCIEHVEGAGQMVCQEKKSLSSIGQKIQSLKREDFRNMSTEELLRAIDLVLS